MRRREVNSTAGVASLSCAPVETPDGTVTVSTSWLVAESMGNHDAAVELVTHEAGHNLSLNHARSGSAAQPRPPDGPLPVEQLHPSSSGGGAVKSWLTRTAKQQVPVLPAASVAVAVTCVVPTLTSEPGAWL